jgi:hypothetical protein
MALTACPECRNEISTMAATCPRCGAPVGQVTDHGPRPDGRGDSTGLTSRRRKVHTAIAALVVLGSSVGLSAQTGRAAGAGVLAIITGLLLAIGLLYYIEVRVRDWWHQK